MTALLRRLLWLVIVVSFVVTAFQPQPQARPAPDIPSWVLSGICGDAPDDGTSHRDLHNCTICCVSGQVHADSGLAASRPMVWVGVELPDSATDCALRNVGTAKARAPPALS